MGAVPGVRGVTVGTAVGRVCAGGRRNAQAPLPGKATPGDATGGRDPRTRFKAKRPHAQEDVCGSVIYKSERPRSRSARPRGARHVKSRHVGPERSGMRIT